jgi:hypothetical protein
MGEELLRNDPNPMAKELVNLAKTGESVAIEISPLYFSTWDDGKVK